jgi:GR25 family glycosyltransferase involved in LPS biosynthesis
MSAAAALAALHYRGTFINLDRAPKRWAALTAQLVELGIDERYRRFAAIDGASLNRHSPHGGGVVGVFASHMAVIEEAAREAVPTHVMEDDVVLGPVFVPLLATLGVRDALAQYDIVFTEVQLPLNLQALKHLKEQYNAATVDPSAQALAQQVRTFDLARLSFACASSYFVSPRGAARLVPLLRREWETGPQLQIDLLFRREAQQGRIRAACLFPFVTTISLDSIFDSTAGGYGTRWSELAVAMLRYAFFVGADFDGQVSALLGKLNDWADEGTPDRQRRFLADVLAVILSRPFQIY